MGEGLTALPTKHMAIFLDSITRDRLERTFSGVLESDWVGQRIKKMLKDDRDRLETYKGCDHVQGEYTGTKVCCSKCGAYFNPGHHEEWILRR